MKTQRIAMLAATLTLAGCEMDFGFGLDLSGWGCCYPRLAVEGPASIGTVPTMIGEATVLVYAPSDTVAPVPWQPAAWICSTGSYCVDFGSYADPTYCTYRVRTQRWDGVRSELRPLFAAPPVPCAPGEATFQGASSTLPAYELLTDPFTITGTVYLDSLTADRAMASAELWLRPPKGSVTLPTDSSGTFRYSTSDAAERFALCGAVSVVVTAGARTEFTSLGAVGIEACGPERRFRDARFGWLRAATGQVYGAGWHEHVGAGAAKVELLAPGDSTVVGEAAWTSDDGGYQLWFPYGMPSPGCGWLIRATRGASTETRRLDDATGCGYPRYHSFSLGG